jgi:hypothetical protein
VHYAPLSEILQDYLKDNPGEIQEKAIKSISSGYKNYRPFSRVPILRAIDKLTKDLTITFVRDPIKNKKLLFLNEKNEFVQMYKQLDAFESDFTLLINKVKKGHLAPAYKNIVRFSRGYNITYSKAYAMLSDAEQLWIHLVSTLIEVYQAVMLHALTSIMRPEEVLQVAAYSRLFRIVQSTVLSKEDLYEMIPGSRELIGDYSLENMRQISRELANHASNDFDVWHFFEQVGMGKDIDHLHSIAKPIAEIHERKRITYTEVDEQGLAHPMFSIPKFWHDFGARTIQVVISARNRWLQKKGKPLKSTEIPLEYNDYVLALKLASYLDTFKGVTDFQHFFSRELQA